MAVAIGLFVIDTLLPSSIGAAIAGGSFLGISGAALIGYSVIGAPPVGLRSELSCPDPTFRDSRLGAAEVEAFC